MNEPKLFASLTPSLLARKGGARPAMRPQLGPLSNFPSSVGQSSVGQSSAVQPLAGHSSAMRQIDEDDLGWNDMGDTEFGDTPEAVPMQIKAGQADIVQLPGTMPAAPIHPEVVRQQEDVAERLAVSVQTQRRQRRPALDGGRRAAFTLRIDPDRHLQLRLACTLAGRSAQQLMTDALDRLFSELPDVSALAAKVRNGRN